MCAGDIKVKKQFWQVFKKINKLDALYYLVRKMDEEKKKLNTNHLIKKCAEGYFFIFGTGFVAERFLSELRRRGIDSRLKGFVVSSRKNDIWNGYPVYEVNNIEEYGGEQVYIAVHERNYIQIKQILPDKIKKNCIWIYPYLADLEFGEPIKTHIKRAVSDLVKEDKNLCRIAIFSLVIDDIVQADEEEIGICIYRKYQNIFSNKRTTKEKERLFVKRILKYKNEGSHKKYPIKILEDNDAVIDGTHRLSLANYFGEKEILCNVYSYAEYDWMKKTHLSEYHLKHILSEEEYKRLIEMMDKIRGV